MRKSISTPKCNRLANPQGRKFQKFYFSDIGTPDSHQNWSFTGSEDVPLLDGVMFPKSTKKLKFPEKILFNKSGPITRSNINLEKNTLRSQKYKDLMMYDKRNTSYEEMHAGLQPKVLNFKPIKDDLIFQQTPSQDYIIQPKSMMKYGSMCVTELYSKSMRIRVVSELLKQQQLIGPPENQKDRKIDQLGQKATQELLDCINMLDKKKEEPRFSPNSSLNSTLTRYRLNDEVGSSHNTHRKSNLSNRSTLLKFCLRKDPKYSKSDIPLNLERNKSVSNDENEKKKIGNDHLEFAKRKAKKLPMVFARKMLAPNASGLIRTRRASRSLSRNAISFNSLMKSKIMSDSSFEDSKQKKLTKSHELLRYGNPAGGICYKGSNIGVLGKENDTILKSPKKYTIQDDHFYLREKQHLQRIERREKTLKKYYKQNYLEPLVEENEDKSPSQSNRVLSSRMNQINFNKIKDTSVDAYLQQNNRRTRNHRSLIQRIRSRQAQDDIDKHKRNGKYVKISELIQECNDFLSQSTSISKYAT